jgi:signal transduction histidine kinase
MAPGDTVDEPGAAAMSCRRSRRPVRLLRALAGDLLACAGIAVALTIILVAFSNQESSLERWLWAFAFNMIVATAIGLLLSNLYRFVQPWFLKQFPGRVGYWASHALIVTSGVGVGVELALRITTALGGPDIQVLRSDVLQVALVVTVVVTAAAVGFETLRERARRVELTAQRAQQEALRAQLEALQARTNPHFLFNSLNTVAGLIEEDPRKAEDVLERLSGLFRYSLEGSRTDWVRLEQEIDAVRGYLEVEHVRLGDRLRSEVHVAPETQSILVPPLLLQPLVENAVLHAIAPRSEGGRLTVSARRNGAALCLEVTDNGPGIGSSRHRGSGTSLEDLHQRLEMIYGGRARLDVSSPDDAGCRVALTLPIGTPGDELVKEAT